MRDSGLFVVFSDICFLFFKICAILLAFLDTGRRQAAQGACHGSAGGGARLALSNGRMMLRRKRIFACPREGLSYEEIATPRGTRPSLRQRKKKSIELVVNA